MNTRLIREKIKEKGLTIEELANRMSIDRSTLYRKLQDDGETFKVSEMKRLISTLELTSDEVNRIFFAQIVAYMRNLKKITYKKEKLNEFN